MQAVFKLVGQVADSAATVLIQGESGTGKELIARAIHANSRRRYAPIIAVNCGGLPETLLETNAHLLQTRRGGIAASALVEHAEIVEPVRIEEDVVIRGGRIGPNVTLERGARAVQCEIADSVVGPGAVLEHAKLRHSLVGGHSVVRHVSGTLLVTDHSVVVGG